LAELSENPLSGARYAYHVVGLRLPDVEAEAAAPDDRLAEVRRRVGWLMPTDDARPRAADRKGVLTAVLAILDDVAAAAPASPPAELDVERLAWALAVLDTGPDGHEYSHTFVIDSMGQFAEAIAAAYRDADAAD
jgi:hypothetical protein